MDCQYRSQYVHRFPVFGFSLPPANYGVAYQYQGNQIGGVLVPATSYVLYQNVYHDPNIDSSSAIIPASHDNQAACFGTFYKNDLLVLSSNDTLQILGYLGEGTFGKVLLGKCYPSGIYVAIKTLKNSKSVHQEVKREVNFLERIRAANGNQFHLLQYHYTFVWRDRYCLVFEALQQSLRTFMNRRNNQALRLNEMRPIIKQILEALVKLEELEIIHTDLKPENVMLVNTTTSPYRIKIIDFGSAIALKEVRYYRNLQTMFYRSPEVILGSPYSHAIDMWSLGCIAGELYLGSVLFKGYSPFEQMRAIIRTLGLPDKESLKNGKYTEKYFIKRGRSSWTIKDRSQDEEKNQTFRGEERRFRLTCLDDLLYHGAFKEPYPYTVPHDQHAFVDLMKEMLTYKHTSRITPKEALQRDYITMPNLVKYCDNCSYARESLAIMRNF